MRSYVALGALLLLQCGPKPGEDGSQDDASAGTTVAGDTAGTTVAGDSTGTGGDAGTNPSDPSDPGPVDTSVDPSGNPSGEPQPTTSGFEDTDTDGLDDEFSCPGARWVVTAPVAGTPHALSVDSRGHVLMVDLGGASWDVHHIDSMGVLVGTTAIADGQAFVRWGGVDAENNWYAATRAPGDLPVRTVRKFDGEGASVWDRDLGPAPTMDVELAGLAVAPNGSTALTERWFDGGDQTRLVRHDASGALVWDQQGPALVEVLAMNDQGEMAAIRLNGGGGEVQALAPDATTTWTHDWWILDGRWASITAGGDIFLGAPSTLNRISAARFAVDGTVAWGHDIEPTDDQNDRFNDFAVNASGEIAIGAQRGPLTSVYVAKLDAVGEVLKVRGCGPSFSESRVAIDDAGSLYLAGSASVDGQIVQFVAAFD